jgi:conserved oligomeric Golgi complex subunit 2
MGQLDEGGPRGECAGLKSLLEDMIVTIEQTFGSVLQLSEVMFDVRPKVQVDLITDGVWVPIATALMADAGIKMAIFSPGIASILQSNYVALDEFLSDLAARLLRETSANAQTTDGSSTVASLERLYFTPKVSKETIQRAQERIYSHPKTADFSKRWNLPIYYQLRFGDCCTRLNKAIDLTTRGGWTMEVYTGDPSAADTLKNTVGFELSFFLELYDILSGLWKPDVILRPLTNRFLRGAVQLVGRSVTFLRDGMDGKTKFGGSQPSDGQPSGTNGSSAQLNGVPLPSSRMPYSWGDSAPDVASVAWELAILDTSLSHDYVTTICDALDTPTSTDSDRNELRKLVSEIFIDTSDQIRPIVERAWNEIIVRLLVEKCSAPLAAVKGVVATYRMTNRPPPTQASPYVGTILRPLKEFSRDFELRTPDHIGSQWKMSILTVVTEKYGTAVEELISTVQRTEVALQSRRARRATSGGISDGDKVKLQLYLDFQAYCRDIQDVGVAPSSIEGISKLQELTQEAQKIQENGTQP